MGFDWFKGFGPVPVPGVVNYLPTWHNRNVRSNHGTWSTARNGYNLTEFGSYQRPQSVLNPNTYLLAMYYLGRSWLNFNTQGIGSISAARLGVYVTSKTGLSGAIFITKGLALEPIDGADWPAQTGETTIFGQFNLADIVLNQYNWADLNAAGLAWLNQSALELNQHESYDWGKNMFMGIYNPYWSSQSRTPQSTFTLTKVRLRLKRVGSPGTLYIRIYAADANHCPTGPVLASATINGNTLTTDYWGAWYLIDLGAGCVFTQGTEYCTVLYIAGGNASNCVQWIGATGNQYPNGCYALSSNAGSSWTPNTNYDLYFIDYETAQVGGTNFCLRADYDVNDIPPIIGADHTLIFNSAQKGEGYLPLLEVTA